MRVTSSYAQRLSTDTFVSCEPSEITSLSTGAGSAGAVGSMEAGLLRPCVTFLTTVVFPKTVFTRITTTAMGMANAIPPTIRVCF